MPTWTNTRLAVLVGDSPTTPLTPIDSFTPTFNLATEIVHSIEATHIGYVSNPANFTFTLTVKAIGGSSAMLTKLAMEGTEFSVGLYVAGGSANEWDFKQILFRKCLITTANPTNAMINGAPTATFSGVAREAGVTSKDSGGEMKLPTFTS